MKTAEDGQRKPKGGAVARIAARWCRDPAFQQWIQERSGREGRRPGDETPENAEAMTRALILVACSISSRAELDHDAAAAQRFDELVRRPYLAHLAAIDQHGSRRMDAALAGRMDAWMAGMSATRAPACARRRSCERPTDTPHSSLWEAPVFRR